MTPENRERALTTIRQRSNGHMTATEIMIAMGGWAYEEEKLSAHTERVFVPILCGQWGRITLP